MSGRVTKLKGDVPKPKAQGVIQKSSLWKNALNLIASGEEVQIDVPSDFMHDQGITSPDPTNSFRLSLDRYIERQYKGKLRVYRKGNTIYVIKK